MWSAFVGNGVSGVYLNISPVFLTIKLINKILCDNRFTNACQGQFKIVGFRQSKNVGFGQFN